MKKLDFNFCLKAIDGKPLEMPFQTEFGGTDLKAVYAYDMISGCLLSAAFKEGDAIKKFTLATAIYLDKKIDVDESDFLLIKNSVKNPDSQPTLIKAQLLIYLESIKSSNV